MCAFQQPWKLPPEASVRRAGRVPGTCFSQYSVAALRGRRAGSWSQTSCIVALSRVQRLAQPCRWPCCWTLEAAHGSCAGEPDSLQLPTWNLVGAVLPSKQNVCHAVESCSRPAHSPLACLVRPVDLRFLALLLALCFRFRSTLQPRRLGLLQPAPSHQPVGVNEASQVCPPSHRRAQQQPRGHTNSSDKGSGGVDARRRRGQRIAQWQQMQQWRSKNTECHGSMCAWTRWTSSETAVTGDRTFCPPWLMSTPRQKGPRQVCGARAASLATTSPIFS
jgi:hypothetical protein